MCWHISTLPTQQKTQRRLTSISFFLIKISVFCFRFCFCIKNFLLHVCYCCCFDGGRIWPPWLVVYAVLISCFCLELEFFCQTDCSKSRRLCLINHSFLTVNCNETASIWLVVYYAQIICRCNKLNIKLMKMSSCKYKTAVYFRLLWIVFLHYSCRY